MKSTEVHFSSCCPHLNLLFQSTPINIHWIYHNSSPKWQCQNPGTPSVHIKIAGIYGCSSQNVSGIDPSPDHSQPHQIIIPGPPIPTAVMASSSTLVTFNFVAQRLVKRSANKCSSRTLSARSSSLPRKRGTKQRETGGKDMEDGSQSRKTRENRVFLGG